ncbi:hypothetical protein [Mesorhizobium sp. IMUNJ 23232]|uniref:hypothetical protein n=1 Tax=Mesorhizobium sp. IMUNJ 23232 TaxID=3376064 RepID=UPI00379B8738
MALFDKKSRYVKHAKVVHAVDRNGRAVTALTPAAPPPEQELGVHLKKENERLDHLANFYLRDPSAFWRICELNDAIVPDALAERLHIRIPARGAR